MHISMGQRTHWQKPVALSPKYATDTAGAILTRCCGGAPRRLGHDNVLASAYGPRRSHAQFSMHGSCVNINRAPPELGACESFRFAIVIFERQCAAASQSRRFARRFARRFG